MVLGGLTDKSMSFQRQDKLFDKSKVKYNDGDNT